MHPSFERSLQWCQRSVRIPTDGYSQRVGLITTAYRNQFLTCLGSRLTCPRLCHGWRLRGRGGRRRWQPRARLGKYGRSRAAFEQSLVGADSPKTDYGARFPIGVYDHALSSDAGRIPDNIAESRTLHAIDHVRIRGGGWRRRRGRRGRRRSDLLKPIREWSDSKVAIAWLQQGAGCWGVSYLRQKWRNGGEPSFRPSSLWIVWSKSQ